MFKNLTCIVCGNTLEEGRLRTCSRGCTLEYAGMRLKDKLRTDFSRKRQHHNSVMASIAAHSIRHRQTCPTCGDTFYTTTKFPRDGFNCAECEKKRIAQLRNHNLAIMLSRKSGQQWRQAMSEFYSMKNAGVPGAFICTKFDQNLEPLTSYLVSADECACPRGQQKRPNCRHQKMIPVFRHNKHIGDGWLLDFDTRRFQPPPLQKEIEEEIENDGDIIDDQSVTQAPDDREAPEGILPPEVEPPVLPEKGARPSMPSSGAPKLIRRILR